jgi:hypothetical protein
MILASRIAPVAGPAACGRRLRGCLRWSPAGPFMPALDGQHQIRAAAAASHEQIRGPGMA